MSQIKIAENCSLTKTQIRNLTGGSKKISKPMFEFFSKKTKTNRNITQEIKTIRNITKLEKIPLTWFQKKTDSWGITKHKENIDNAYEHLHIVKDTANNLCLQKIKKLTLDYKTKLLILPDNSKYRGILTANYEKKLEQIKTKYGNQTYDKITKSKDYSIIIKNLDTEAEKEITSSNIDYY